MRTALLVPCYNAVRFLPRLREQVDRLSPAFDEVLLADDASKDDTASFAEQMGFRVLRLKSNLGPGGARNALARASKAEWIHFHDVDDELAPDYLARVTPLASPNVDAVFHHVDFINETTRELVIRWQIAPSLLARDPAGCLLRHPMPTPSTLVRRTAFLNAGGFDEIHRCFEDGDFNFRLALSGARFAALPEVLEWSLRRDDGAGANQHYCFSCRLDYLHGYAATAPARLHPHIAVETERAAAMLLRFGDKPAARRALALCRRLGHRVPATDHPLFRLLRPILPSLTLLRWQDAWRQRRKNRPTSTSP